MAEWYRVRLGDKKSSVTFGAIGYPFSFTSAPEDWDKEWEWAYCCFEAPEERTATMRSLVYLPYRLRERKRSDALAEDEDGWQLQEVVEEDGWYLSGVGHHELWCGSTIEEAVDAAQEYIAWDGSDPLNLPMESGERTEEGRLIHRMPAQPLSVWHDDTLWFGAFSGKRPKREQ